MSIYECGWKGRLYDRCLKSHRNSKSILLLKIKASPQARCERRFLTVSDASCECSLLVVPSRALVGLQDFMRLIYLHIWKPLSYCNSRIFCLHFIFTHCNFTNFSSERSRSVQFRLNFGARRCCRDRSMFFFFLLGVFLISVKRLTTENTKIKLHRKFVKFLHFVRGSYVRK